MMGTEKRLIDANALMEAVRQEDERSGNKWTSYDFDCLISTQPTVDAVEVVNAEWFDIRFDPMWRSMLATCSHCKVRGEVRVKSNECGFAVPDSNYCPNCDAKMNGVADG